MGYELLDDDLTKSTLWMFGSKDAKLLFVTILAECHGSEICRVPIPVLFKLAGLTPTEGVEALIELCSEDPDSKCQAEKGARIVRIVDEIGKGLRLPSYRERRNRYMTKRRMAELRERADEKKRQEKKERDAALRLVTPRDGEFASEAAAAAAAEKKKKGGSAGASHRASPAPFIPPTVEEVRGFAEEEKLDTFNADTFVDFYASKGWTVGKAPMKDWRAAARNAARKGWTTETKKAPATAAGSHGYADILVGAPGSQERADAMEKGRRS